MRFFTGAVCVALVAWVWSTLFYVISPVPYWTMTHLEDDRAAGAALKEIFPETGTYLVPGHFADKETRRELRGNGPVATVYFQRDGASEAGPFKIVVGTINSIITGLLIGVSLLMLNRLTTDYWTQVKIGAMFGIAYTTYPRFADIIWSDFPPGYQLMMIFSDGASWILMVMVMAWFTIPRPAAATA